MAHPSKSPFSSPASTMTTATSASQPATPSSMVSLSSKPTLLEVLPMRFVIMDAPRQTNLHLYIKELSKYHVHHVVRVCEPTYHAEGALQNAGMCLHEMEYPDGHPPPTDIIDHWLQLVDATFYSKASAATKTSSASNNSNSNNTKNHTNNATTTTNNNNNNSSITANNASSTSPPSSSSLAGVPLDDPAIAVHCVAGLGRAPVLVAIALIEFANMDPVEAVSLIRRHRRGSINEKQLLYLEGYKRRYKQRYSSSSSSKRGDGACIVM